MEEGWDMLSAKTRESETPEPEDDKSVVADVAKSGGLPRRESDLVPYSFPASVWAQLSAARKRRAVGGACVGCSLWRGERRRLSRS